MSVSHSRAHGHEEDRLSKPVRRSKKRRPARAPRKTPRSPAEASHAFTRGRRVRANMVLMEDEQGAQKLVGFVKPRAWEGPPAEKKSKKRPARSSEDAVIDPAPPQTPAPQLGTSRIIEGDDQNIITGSLIAFDADANPKGNGAE